MNELIKRLDSYCSRFGVNKRKQKVFDSSAMVVEGVYVVDCEGLDIAYVSYRVNGGILIYCACEKGDDVVTFAIKKSDTSEEDTERLCRVVRNLVG